MGRTCTVDEQRERMITHDLRDRDITDPRVLEAFERVPREAFVGAGQEAHAYDDAPLPIGFDQTISQPYVVAMTVQALALTGDERVLEIGTGSGYAAAILAELAREVHTVERIHGLADAATHRLATLGYHDVHVHHADGTLGWPAAAPFDAIAVSAGAPRPPPALLRQLAIGGRLVIPHGADNDQHLTRFTRVAEDEWVQRDLGAVRFVRLVGAEGWPEPPR